MTNDIKTKRTALVMTKVDLGLCVSFTILGLFAIILIIPNLYDDNKDFWFTANITILIVHIIVFILTVASGVAAYLFSMRYIQQSHELND